MTDIVLTTENVFDLPVFDESHFKNREQRIIKQAGIKLGRNNR